jgi:GTP cyclohydrolase I
MALPEKNEQEVAVAIKMLLQALGEDPTRSGIKDTPSRVARLYSDILDGNYADPPKVTSFKEEGYHGIVSVHHFPFYSFCEHHLVPFQGQAAIAYIPDKITLGLSKLIRIFRFRCKRVTIQERLTQEALTDIVEYANPKGAIVCVQAEHMCMTLRGVKSPGSITTTMAYAGEFETNIPLREQFLMEAQK